MTNELLIRLYKRKDPKRKRMLFNMFKDMMVISASLSTIAELINQELGQQNLIKSADIKYCRFYFLGKELPTNANNNLRQIINPRIKTESPELSRSINSNLITWTNPDDSKSHFNKEIKSKFSNK